MNKEDIIQHEWLLCRLMYDPETGHFRWKQRPASDFKSEGACSSWNSKYSGTVAGTETEGRIEIRIKVGDYRPVRYKAHRLAWFYVYGVWPEAGKVIDHIDGNATNNRLDNLRVVDYTSNNRNKRLQHNNSSGRVGVYWDSRVNKWVARGVKDSKSFFLGQSSDWDVACKIREDWEQKESNYTARNGSFQ